MNILDPYVDKFVLTEGDTTFSGSPKESVYLQNKERFAKWEDKIIHNFIEIPDLPTTWDRRSILVTHQFLWEFLRMMI